MDRCLDSVFHRFSTLIKTSAVSRRLWVQYFFFFFYKLIERNTDWEYKSSRLWGGGGGGGGCPLMMTKGKRFKSKETVKRTRHNESNSQPELVIQVHQTVCTSCAGMTHHLGAITLFFWMFYTYFELVWHSPEYSWIFYYFIFLKHLFLSFRQPLVNLVN